MRWISFVNLILVVAIGLSVVGIVFALSRPTPRIETIAQPLEKQMPKRPFEMAKLASMSQGPFALNWVEPTLELPNLAQAIHYHGPVQRPDALAQKPSFHLSFAGSHDLFLAQSGEPLYLTYLPSRSQTGSVNGPIWGEEEIDVGYYPSDVPTSLWLDMVPRQQGKLLDVTVHMVDDQNREITSPSKYRGFTLTATEATKTRQSVWELDDLRVDSTLLIRQKARWIGPDQFLVRHGGEGYSHAAARERVDFQIGERPYSCFVKAGDFLIWKEGKWREGYRLSEPTLGYPLLAVKKIEDKVMSFELWDCDGISKIPLNLIKARDLGGMPNLSEEFRFVGAKTWAQFIIESRSARLILRPYDWLVLTNEGWIKLDSPEKIDDYVSQKLVGPLLILDKLKKQNGKQVLTGHLYNTTRSEVESIEIPAILNAYASQHAPVPSSLPSLEQLANGGLQ